MGTEEKKLEQFLVEAYQDKIHLYHNSDMPEIEVPSAISYEFIKFLKENPHTNFTFLTDVCGVQYIENTPDKRFAVVYHLHNWITNVRIRVKVYLSEEKPEIESVSSLFKSANWQERETYDFYGIIFLNHPNLKRILNMDEMLSFPLRKEYKLEDDYRTDKDNRYFGRELVSFEPALDPLEKVAEQKKENL